MRTFVTTFSKYVPFNTAQSIKSIMGEQGKAYRQTYRWTDRHIDRYTDRNRFFYFVSKNISVCDKLPGKLDYLSTMQCFNPFHLFIKWLATPKSVIGQTARKGQIEGERWDRKGKNRIWFVYCTATCYR